jgi:hypothetical protein
MLKALDIVIAVTHRLLQEIVYSGKTTQLKRF